MRKGFVSLIVALSALGFAAAAQAEGDCAWSGRTVASTPKPAVTAETSKVTPAITISTRQKLAHTAKSTKTKNGG